MLITVQTNLTFSLENIQNVPGNDLLILLVDGSRLVVAGSHQVVLEGSDVLDALVLEGLQADVKGLLFGEEGLDAGQVPAEVVKGGEIEIIYAKNLTLPLKLLICPKCTCQSRRWTRRPPCRRSRSPRRRPST